MLPHLIHSVTELADYAFSGDGVHIRLGIRRVGELHPRCHGKCLEPFQASGVVNSHGIPCLRLNLKADAPFRMGLQLVCHVISVGLQRIVAINTAMKAIHEIHPVLGIYRNRHTNSCQNCRES